VSGGKKGKSLLSQVEGGETIEDFVLRRREKGGREISYQGLEKEGGRKHPSEKGLPYTLGG